MQRLDVSGAEAHGVKINRDQKSVFAYDAICWMDIEDADLSAKVSMGAVVTHGRNLQTNKPVLFSEQGVKIRPIRSVAYDMGLLSHQSKMVILGLDADQGEFVTEEGILQFKPAQILARGSR